MTTSTRELWRQVDALEAAYARLLDRRNAVWQQMTAHRLAGAERQARRVESDLHLLDGQGLALAARIADLCAAAGNFGS